MSRPSRAARWFRYLVLAILVVLASIIAHHIGAWLVKTITLEIGELNKNFMISAIVLAMVFYALLLAIPFIPGVEIGFGLIIMFGVDLVIPVYVATLFGISLAFFLGRVIPLTTLQSLLRFIYMERAADLIARLAPLSHHDKMQALAESAPKRFVPFLLRHRYLAIAAAINIPGNAVIGGGGGIGMMAGISRLFPWPYFALTIVLAVAPMPIFLLIFGPGFLG